MLKAKIVTESRFRFQSFASTGALVIFGLNQGSVRLVEVEEAGHHLGDLLDGEHDEGDRQQLQVLLHGRHLLLLGRCHLHLVLPLIREVLR